MCRQHRTVLLCFVLGQKKKTKFKKKKKKKRKKGRARKREPGLYGIVGAVMSTSSKKKKKNRSKRSLLKPTINILIAFLRRDKSKFQLKGILQSFIYHSVLCFYCCFGFFFFAIKARLRQHDTHGRVTICVSFFFSLTESRNPFVFTCAVVTKLRCDSFFLFRLGCGARWTERRRVSDVSVLTKRQ